MMYSTVRNKTLDGESGGHQGQRTLQHNYVRAYTWNGFDGVTAALHCIRGLIV